MTTPAPRAAPMPLVCCSECKRLWQRSAVPSQAHLIREHRMMAPRDAGVCKGSLKPPAQHEPASVTHRLGSDAGQPVLSCCGKRPAQVPVFDRFTIIPQHVTCPGAKR